MTERGWTRLNRLALATVVVGVVGGSWFSVGLNVIGAVALAGLLVMIWSGIKVDQVHIASTQECPTCHGEGRIPK